ncbi:hypothetical protein MHLNE_01350 [Moorella humiferrea]|uniref:CvpA family protein n=1 Tax=Neomoorella humiferrea TaxID=676965 RepID=UPI0030CC19F9
MLNYVDLLLLLLLAAGACQGYRYGFVNLIAGWISYLVAALAGVLYARPLAEVLDRAWNLTDRWGQNIAPLLPLPRPVLGQPWGKEALNQLGILLNSLPLPETVKQSILEGAAGASGNILGQVLAARIAFLGLELLTLAGIFGGTLFFLRRLARWGMKGGIVPGGFFNRGLGLFMGLLGRAFWLAVAVGAARFIFSLPFATAVPALVPVARQFYNSEVARHLNQFYDWLLVLWYTLI